MKFGKYEIKSDTYSVELGVYKTALNGKRKGELVYKAIGWYPDFQMACKSIVRKELLASELKDLDTAIKIFSEAEQEIDKKIEMLSGMVKL